MKLLTIILNQRTLEIIGGIFLVVAIFWFCVLFFEDRNKHNMP